MLEDDIKYLPLNKDHPENLDTFRKMCGLKVCGFCDRQYNPSKHFDGVMYKEDEDGESKPVCHRCLYPYKYSY